MLQHVDKRTDLTTMFLECRDKPVAGWDVGKVETAACSCTVARNHQLSSSRPQTGSTQTFPLPHTSSPPHARALSSPTDRIPSCILLNRPSPPPSSLVRLTSELAASLSQRHMTSFHPLHAGVPVSPSFMLQTPSRLSINHV